MAPEAGDPPTPSPLSLSLPSPDLAEFPVHIRLGLPQMGAPGDPQRERCSHVSAEGMNSQLPLGDVEPDPETPTRGQPAPGRLVY